jgi:hypothetical protein
MSPSHNTAEFGRINSQCTEQVTNFFLYNQIDIIMSSVQEFLHEGFARMGEWPMADIMEEGSRDYQNAFIICKPEAA